VLLALGTGGITYESEWLYFANSPDSASFAATWSWCTLSALAIAISVMALHRLRKETHPEPECSQQLTWAICSQCRLPSPCF